MYCSTDYVLNAWCVRWSPTAWQVTITSDTPDFNFHTAINCVLHALLFVDSVITLIMNYVHIHYFAVT